MNTAISNTIKAHVAEDCATCTHFCEDFKLFSNSLIADAYFVRYTRHDVRGGGSSSYRWICFDGAGQRTDCDPIFEKQKNKYAFYAAMEFIEQLSDCKNNYLALVE